jgi:hypothetical protein
MPGLRRAVESGLYGRWRAGRRPNAKEWALRGRIGAVAATLMDGETAASCAKDGSPERKDGSGRVSSRRRKESSPRAVLGANDDFGR